MEATICVEHTNKHFTESNLLEKTRGLTNIQHCGTLNELNKEDEKQHSLGIRLEREGYFTVPSLAELAEVGVDDQGRCVVDSFTVGLVNYGMVEFEGPLDVANLFLDEIVLFRHKEVTVYPDDLNKPAEGDGLNRPAKISLFRVWPLNRTSNEFIKDPKTLCLLNYREKLVQTAENMDAEFVDYFPENGTWIFKVKHFTKYGLDESDEENELPAVLEIPIQSTAAQQTLGKNIIAAVAQPGFTGLSGLSAQPKPFYEPSDMITEEDMGIEEDFTLQQQYRGAALTETAASPPPASVQLARALGMPSQRVQIMKASFFDTDDYTMENWETPSLPVASATPSRSVALKRHVISPLPSLEVPSKTPSQLLLRSFAADQSEMSLAEVSFKPIVGLDDFSSYTKLEPSVPITEKQMKVVPRFAAAEFPVEESWTNGKTKDIADSALFHGRSFRIGWGPDWSLASLSDDESYAVAIQKVGPALAHPKEEELFERGSSDICTALLATYLEHGTEKSDGLQFIPVRGTDCLLQLRETTAKLLDKSSGLKRDKLDYMLKVWDLCIALWGPLPEEDAMEGSHAEIIARREALGHWLEKSSSRKSVKLNPADQILELLASHDIAEACKAAQSAGEHRLALLLAQAGSSSVFKTMLQRQLQQWAESKADQFVAKPRMKIFATLGGTQVWNSSKSTLNTCEELDWIEAFAHHLWYVVSPVASIADALAEYEAACGLSDAETEAYAARPVPPYGVNEVNVKDLRYHLVQLYCRRSTPLEPLLNPLSHTADPLDHTFSWLLWQQLQSIGYSHLSKNGASLLDTSFAAQLERMGLWHWSVLVLLHSANPEPQLAEILSRHIQIDQSDARETFVRSRLGIADDFIEAQRAIRARYLGLPLEEARALLKANQFHEAHHEIFEKLAPEAILAENYQGLEELMNPLANRGSTIDQWHIKGKVLLDYIKVVKTVESLLAKVREAEKLKQPNWENMTQLEHLTPDLLSLSSQIPQMVSPSPKHKLCKAEIAQRTSYILRVVIGLQSGSAAADAVVPSRLLLPQLQQLPVTQDYALKELRNLVRSFLLELNV